VNSDPTSGVARPQVYTIEDNPADVRLVEEGIDAAGTEIDLQVINNGRRAIDQLTGVETDERHPDLVLLDLNLPDKSGFEVLTAIRAETAFREVPVVVVSSSDNSADIKQAYDAAANAYVMKPADPDKYIQMVDSVVDFWITNTTYDR